MRDEYAGKLPGPTNTMPPSAESSPSQPAPLWRHWTIPPRGGALLFLLAAYLLTGLGGHEPWKNDDIVSIAIVWDMVARGHWLIPHLSNSPVAEPPLYYWSAALTHQVFVTFLAAHDAMRLASGLWLSLTLWFLYRASREIYREEPQPHEQAIACVLVFIGSLGLLIHAHEAQPMLVALCGHAAAYWGYAIARRNPPRSALLLCIAVFLTLLGQGLAATLPLLILTLVSPLTLGQDQRYPSRHLLLGSLAGGLLSLAWFALVAQQAPDMLASWWSGEWQQFASDWKPLANAAELAAMLPWFAWPALPLAGWSLWQRRRDWKKCAPGQRLIGPCTLPIVALLLTWVSAAAFLAPRSSTALLLLPPLALLAAAGLPRLRRGAAMAFDWFGVMTFTFFSLLIWVGWLAMAWGWPERLAQRVVKLAPGYEYSSAPLPVGLALLVGLAWFWLVINNQRIRSPWRGLTHWVAGLSCCWLTLIALWLPWIEHGKGYREVSAGLSSALGAAPGCVTGVALSDAHRAYFDYYAGIVLPPEPAVRHREANSTAREPAIEIRAEAAAATSRCDWLLLHFEHLEPQAPALAGWQTIGNFKRPADRRERFALYRRLEPVSGP